MQKNTFTHNHLYIEMMRTLENRLPPEIIFNLTKELTVCDLFQERKLFSLEVRLTKIVYWNTVKREIPWSWHLHIGPFSYVFEVFSERLGKKSVRELFLQKPRQSANPISCSRACKGSIICFCDRWLLSNRFPEVKLAVQTIELEAIEIQLITSYKYPHSIQISIMEWSVAWCPHMFIYDQQ